MREQSETREHSSTLQEESALDEPTLDEPSLGAAVRGAREAAGLTLEQVSERTRIRPAVLRDLEAGSTDRSGGAAYARGHLRAVAAVTRTDPALLLAAHDRSVGALAPPTPAGTLVLPARTREPTGPRWGAAAAAAALVLVVLVLVGSWGGGARRSASPTASRSSPPAPVAAPTAPPAVAALRLRVTGAASWVSVVASGGTPLFTGVLKEGAAREFNDPARLQVTVGNAGAVTVGCAGRDTAAGARGQVRRYTCAPSGLAPA